MKFKKIGICNFGPFCSNHEISFGEGEKKVTVIHGKNGSGKTTIARVFLWVLYNEVELSGYSSKSNIGSKDLTKLVNTKALSEIGKGEVLEVNCSVCFEHSDISYNTVRSFKVKKVSDGVSELLGESDLKVLLTPKGSTTSELVSIKAQQAIEKVLPREMSNYFFFKGELMEKLSMPQNSKQIKEAIETVFGFNIVYDLKKYLSKVQKIIYDQQEKDNKANQRLSDLTSNRADYKGKLDDEKELQDNTKKEIESLERKIKEKEDYLNERKEIAEEQKEKNRLKKTIENLKEENIKLMSRIDEKVLESGYMFLSSGIKDKVKSILSDAKKEGQIPSSLITPTVAEKILDNKICICGNDLSPNSTGAENIKNLINSTYREDLEQNFEKFNNASITLVEAISKEEASIKENYQDLSSNILKINELTDELNYLEERLRGHEDIDISGYQSKISEMKTELIHLKQSELASSNKMEDYEAEIKRLNNSIKLEEKKSGKIGKWSVMGDLTSEADRYLGEFISRKVEATRIKFESKLNEVYERIHLKPYEIKLKEDFTMTICENNDGVLRPVPSASEGEFKITSLTFIASLIEFAKTISDEKKKKTGLSFGGGEYSLVIDAPFGDLDSEYRTATSRALSNMGTQVIILLSDTHWDENVSGEMEGEKDKEYIITHVGAKTDVRFQNTDYYYRRKSDGKTKYQYCEVEEIL